MIDKKEVCTANNRLCTEDNDQWCCFLLPSKTKPVIRYFCSRPKRHEGKHIACSPEYNRHNITTTVVKPEVKPERKCKTKKGKKRCI